MMAAVKKRNIAQPSGCIVVHFRIIGRNIERLAVGEGVRLVVQPPDTPELQPAEPLWPLAREAVANRHFATLADLDRALAARRLELADQPETIRAHTRFHWWPEAA